MVNMWLVRAGEKTFLFDDFKDLGLVDIGWDVDDLTNVNEEVMKKMWGEELAILKKFSLGQPKMRGGN